MAHLRNPPPLYKRKNLAKIFYTTRVVANFVSNFVAILTRVGRGKCNWQHLMAHLRKPFINAKILQNLLHDASYSQFCFKFRCYFNRGRSQKMQLAAFDGPFLKTLLWAQKSRQNLLRKPSYSQFCPKFRCHGNLCQSGKDAIGGIRWLIPENFHIRAKISRKSFTQTEL